MEVNSDAEWIFGFLAGHHSEPAEQYFRSCRPHLRHLPNSFPLWAVYGVTQKERCLPPKWLHENLPGIRQATWTNRAAIGRANKIRINNIFMVFSLF